MLFLEKNVVSVICYNVASLLSLTIKKSYVNLIIDVKVNSNSSVIDNSSHLLQHIQIGEMVKPHY